MEVKNLSFSQRVKVIFRLIAGLLFHRIPSSETSSGWSASPDLPPLPVPRGPRPEVRELLTVIPIAQSQTAVGIDVTLFSLESYNEGFIVLGRHSAKYGEHGPNNIWHAIPVFAAVDDLGNDYQWWPSGGNRNRFESRFAPALDSKAHVLTLTVTQVRWTFISERRNQMDVGPWVFRVPLV